MTVSSFPGWNEEPEHRLSRPCANPQFVGPLAARWRSVLCSALVLFGIGSGALAAELPDARIAWAEPAGAGFDIWFSQTDGDKWVKPVQISLEDQRIDVLACPMVLEDSTMLVVWTSFTGPDKADLLFVYHDGDSWSPPAPIKTDLTVNMAASLLRASNGDIWLAWSGFDGTDDDIFSSRWLPEEREWEVKTRVGRNDVRPDILPVLMLSDEGDVVLRWQALGSTGYGVLESVWDGTVWSSEVAVDAKELVPEKDVILRRLESMPELPEAVVDPNKACINVMDGARVHTVRFPRPERTEVPGQ